MTSNKFIHKFASMSSRTHVHVPIPPSNRGHHKKRIENQLSRAALSSNETSTTKSLKFLFIT